MAAAFPIPTDEPGRLPIPLSGGGSSCRGAAPRSSAKSAGPPGAPTVLLVARLGRDRRAQLVPGVRAARRTLPRRSLPTCAVTDAGLRSRRVFRLADCADDCAATLVELGTGPVIVVGYSMGGPVAQLLWRRHRDLVVGLVLCATTAGFIPNRWSRLSSPSRDARRGCRRARARVRARRARCRSFRCRAAGRETGCRCGSPTRCAATTGA